MNLCLASLYLTHRLTQLFSIVLHLVVTLLRALWMGTFGEQWNGNKWKEPIIPLFESFSKGNKRVE
jgi:hypothetical protein